MKRRKRDECVRTFAWENTDRWWRTILWRRRCVVKKALETSPVPLPEDYIEFLRSISGRICRRLPADPIPLSSRSSPPHILKKSKSGKGFLLPYDYVVISLKPQFHVIWFSAKIQRFCSHPVTIMVTQFTQNFGSHHIPPLSRIIFKITDLGGKVTL